MSLGVTPKRTSAGNVTITWAVIRQSTREPHSGHLLRWANLKVKPVPLSTFQSRTSNAVQPEGAVGKWPHTSLSMNFKHWYFPARSVHRGPWEAEIFDFWVFSSELDWIFLLWVRQTFAHTCWAHYCIFHTCSMWITCETNSDQLPAAKQECQSKWYADVVFSPKHPLPLLLCLPSPTWLFYCISLKIFPLPQLFMPLPLTLHRLFENLLLF